jgi:hypothetical protein
MNASQNAPPFRVIATPFVGWTTPIATRLIRFGESPAAAVLSLLLNFFNAGERHFRSKSRRNYRQCPQ